MSVLRRIEAGLLAVSSRDRQVERAGGFVVAVAPGGAPGLATAVPERPAADLTSALAAVEQRFVDLDAPPAMEYVDELHPGLAAAAHARGWRTVSVAPVMALAQPGWLTAPTTSVTSSTPERHVRWLTDDDEALQHAFLSGQHRAFGGHGDALAWLPLLTRGLRTGGTRAAALEDDGRVVAGAAVQLGAGVAELVGVWTERLERRRGYARTVCGALLADAFERGVDLVWLSAAEGASGLYRQLGFQRVGTQRNLTGPGTPR